MRVLLLILLHLAVASQVNSQTQNHGEIFSRSFHFKMASPRQQIPSEKSTTSSHSISEDQQSNHLSNSFIPFSSFSCSGGIQDTRGWSMRMHENVSMVANRVCLFRNICYRQGELVYYRHPEERRAPASTQLLQTDLEFLKVSFLEYNPSFSVTIRDESRPQHLAYRDNKTWFFSLASYAFNFAHLLIDDLYPVLAALNVFNLKDTQAAVVFSGCATTFKDYTNYYDEGTEDDGRRTVSEICEDNYRLYSKLLFGEAAVEWTTWAGQDFCFERFVVGQGHAYGRRGLYGHPDTQRAVVLRQGRDAIISNLQVLDPPRPSRLHVLIVPKDNAGYLDEIFWRAMCEDVTAVVSGLVKVGELRVTCLPPGLPVEAEIALVRSATLLVAVHGTLSLLSLFARDGTIVISVGGPGAEQEAGYKELDYLPYATHIQVLFHEFKVKQQHKQQQQQQQGVDEFPALVRYALHLSAENFHQSLSDYLL